MHVYNVYNFPNNVREQYILFMASSILFEGYYKQLTVDYRQFITQKGIVGYSVPKPGLELYTI